MLQFKIFFVPSVSLLVFSFCQILSVYILHSTQKPVSQSVNQVKITEFCVIPMIQKMLNCGKYWLEIGWRKKQNESTQKQSSKDVKTHTHTHKHTERILYMFLQQVFFTSYHYLIKITKTNLKTYCEKHLQPSALSDFSVQKNQPNLSRFMTMDSARKITT